MNKPSKAVLSLILLLSAKAQSNESWVSQDLLLEQNLDQVVLEQLFKAKILLPSENSQIFILNEKKLLQVFRKTKSQEAKEFLLWLESVSGDGVKIKLKDPKDMTLGAQDIKG